MRTRLAGSARVPVVSVVTIWTALLSIVGFRSAIGSEAPDAVAASHVSPGLVAVPNDADAFFSPWIHPSMPNEVRRKLQAGFEIAVQRVTEVSSCAELFADLEADPVDVLRDGLYFPANVARETTLCRRSLAQTLVGGKPIWICRRIAAYPDEKAAAVILHEALHHAGVTETSHGRTAMSSATIDDLVREHCDF